MPFFIKQIHSLDTKSNVITHYIKHNSINKVAKEFKLSTRQIISILDDASICHKSKRKVIVNEHYFDNYEDIDKGKNILYWLGFISADGNVYKNDITRNYSLTIKLKSTDLNHLEKFKQEINTSANISTKSEFGGFDRIKYKKKYTCSQIRIYSKYMINYLNNFNIIPNKSLIFEIPQILKDNINIHHYIRGLIDGDGCIRFKEDRRDHRKYLKVSLVGSLQECSMVAKIVSKYCNCNIKNVYKNGKIYQVEWNGTDAVSLVKWLYKDSNSIYLDRKFNLIKHILE